MKAYIFGGAGFVGDYLTQALKKEDFDVAILDTQEPKDKSLEYYNTDITKKETFPTSALFDFDVVVNLAARQYHNKVPKKNRNEYFFSVNTQGAKNIFEWTLQQGGKNVIQYSTDMVYGRPLFLPLTTEHPQNPFGPYGKSKQKAESICLEYRKKGLNITIFRPRMIMGKGRLGILKKLFFLLEHNLPLPLIGNGKNHYQMIAVQDCVSATIQAIKKGCPNNVYNLGSFCPPCEYDLLCCLIKKSCKKSFVIRTPGKLIKLILFFFGKIGLEIMYKEQYEIADKEYILDTSTTQKDLAWQPRYNDSDMILAAFVEWKKENKGTKEHIKKSVYDSF